MTAKWRILWHPLQINLKNVGMVFVCITWLHNFYHSESHVLVNNTDEIQGEEPEFSPSDFSVTSIGKFSAFHDIIVAVN